MRLRAKWLLSLFCFTIYFLVSDAQQDVSQLDQKSSTYRLTVITRLGNPNEDSFLRFNRSIDVHDLRLDLLRIRHHGIDTYQYQLPRVEDLRSESKVQFEALKRKFLDYKKEKELILLLVDSSTSIVNGDEQAILSRFYEFNRNNGTRILFSADASCWPDSNLAEKYPPLFYQSDSLQHQAPPEALRQKYLNSRAVIGFASALYEFIELSNSLRDANKNALLIESVNYDFQLYSTHVYLMQELRNKLQIRLDHQSYLFENLDSNQAIAAASAAAHDQRVVSSMTNVEIEFVNKTQGGVKVELKNLIHNTRPLVVLGSEPSAKVELNSLGNYLAKAWTPEGGCGPCNRSMISLATIKDSDLPSVLVAVFVEEATPFMENFFATLKELNYPKERMHLFIHNAIEYHERHVADFIASKDAKYASKELIDFRTPKKMANEEWQVREYALKKCEQISCDYFLSLDSVARLEWPDSLRDLIQTNKSIVAPLLSRPGKLWSNFWGSITREGYYARSNDYVDLVARERLGVWNVPLVMNAYLIGGKFLRQNLAEQAQEKSIEYEIVQNDNNTGTDKIGSIQRTSTLSYYDKKFPTVKPALIFARNLRNKNIFMFVSNQQEYGHLVDPSNYNISLKYPDFYQLDQNKEDWEREYLHENYMDLFDERDEDEKNYPNRIRLEEPCRDVYWFPLVNEKFCNELIDIMEKFGQWSTGTNSDPRIEGGYESVPTRDIHFRQVGLHEMWLTFLREYVMPIQLKEYIGYEHDPPRTDLAFVVRYNPAEQPSLRPHHDSSTYTLNIALNTPGVDYEGGGCRFVRYNCSVTESRKGWALIHPGRLTHYHEGLPVTKGTRYILVTFVDP